MPDKKKAEKKPNATKIKLVSKLALEPEARTEPAKGGYPGGRIKRFIDIFRANSQTLMLANVLALIFALPLIGVIAAASVIGYEKIAYYLEGLSKAPYLLSHFGIGLSAGLPFATAKAYLLTAHQIVCLAAAAGIPLLSVGAGGCLYIANKLVWGESFVCKKDKFGNNVPRVITEFFRGVKLYWKPSLIISVPLTLIFAAASYLILNFVKCVYLGDLGNALGWVGLVFSAIVGLIGVVYLFNFYPLNATYRNTMKTADKLKNAGIFSVVGFLPTLILAVAAFAPYALFLASSLLQVLGVVFFMGVGIMFPVLIMVNYADYNSENIVQPLYSSAQVKAQNNAQKALKKKNVNHGAVSYKKNKVNKAKKK